MLFVSEFLPNWNSGAEGSLLSIGDALEKRGNRVDYLWKDTASSIFPHPRLHDLFEVPGRQLQRVKKALQQTEYDVVVLSQPYSYLVYERLKGLYPHTLFLNRTHGWEDRLAESWRLLGWREPGLVGRNLSNISADFMTRACERTVKSCHGIVTASSLCATYIKNHYLPNTTPVSVIPYGVESNLFRERMRGGSQRLLFVGQYLPRKGSIVLEQTLPALGVNYPHATLTFVVPANEMAGVASIYRPTFGARLSIHAWMERKELAEIYSQNDILLFPSFFEGFGKVFLEAMAAGLCVIGFREGGLPAIATHGRDAFLCETGDRHAFRIWTEHALANPEWARFMGERAREVAQRYTWERHAIETEKFCHELKFGEVQTAVAC